MISIIIPTRNRPDSLSRIMDSAFQLAKNPDLIEFVFYIDYDDELSLKAIPTLEKNNIKFVIGPRVFLSVAWNILGTQHAKYDIIAPIGDDAIFRTQYWDQGIIDIFNNYPDKIVHVYAKDGLQNEKIGTQAFLHRNWINTLGYVLPPYFFSDFTDTWLTEVGKRIKRSHYTKDIYIEHLHPASGKALLDKTHQERIARINPLSLKLYQKLKFLRKEDAKKLKDFIKNFNSN